MRRLEETFGDATPSPRAPVLRGRGDRQTDCFGCRRHAFVVRHYPGEVGAELLRSREMDRVERAQLQRQQAARGAENAVVDSDELDSCENLVPALHRNRPERKEGSCHLGSSQHARDERPPAP